MPSTCIVKGCCNSVPCLILELAQFVAGPTQYRIQLGFAASWTSVAATSITAANCDPPRGVCCPNGCMAGQHLRGVYQHLSPA
jgi:hypothetical protein